MEFDKKQYSKFCENVWNPYLSSLEAKYPGRKSCSYRMWYSRSRAAQHCMYRYLVENGGLSPPRNPYFWIQQYPEPVPTNHNGTPGGQNMLDRGEAEIAFYNGRAGIYTHEDILLFNLKTKNNIALTPDAENENQ